MYFSRLYLKSFSIRHIAILGLYIYNIFRVFFFATVSFIHSFALSVYKISVSPTATHKKQRKKSLCRTARMHIKWKKKNKQFYRFSLSHSLTFRFQFHTHFVCLSFFCATRASTQTLQMSVELNVHRLAKDILNNRQVPIYKRQKHTTRIHLFRVTAALCTIWNIACSCAPLFWSFFIIFSFFSFVLFVHAIISMHCHRTEISMQCATIVIRAQSI